MSVPLLTTKLNMPLPRSKVVTRLRLVERLNGNTGRRLTLVSAPAGFGKTTLVSEWLASRSQPVAWLSLDEGDGDLKRFLSYLVAALQTLNAEIGAGVLGVLQSPQPPDTEALLTTLLNEIDTLPHNFILVLDDYHLLDSQPVDQALNFLIEHMPMKMHLVITTREDPPLPLARLRARDQLMELRGADLRFTHAEAAEFLKSVMGLELNAEDIAVLETRTEGWIAGLQLAALALQGATDQKAEFIQSFSGAHHFVLDYLIEEVLQQQPETIQAFLLRTSILNRLCGPLCDVMLAAEAGSGQEMLETLERANLFIIPLDGERRWYRYHHLFGNLLRQRLGQIHTSEEVAGYHLHASEWYEKNGDAAEAFHHAIAAGNFERAAEVAEKVWEAMDESFRSGEWLGWVNQLPARVRRIRPVLCTQIAWAYMDAGQMESSESYLQDAEYCLNELRDEMVVVHEAQFLDLPARIAIARAYNAQVRNDLAETIKYGEQALALAPEDSFLHAQAAVTVGATHWTSGNLDAAAKVFQDWIDSTRRAGNIIFSIASESGKADILTAQGHLREALQTYQRSLEFSAAYESETRPIIAHHYLGVAMLYHEMGEEEAAAPHFQKSLEMGEHSTLVDWRYRWNVAQARVKESEEDVNAAIVFLEEAKRVYVKTPIPNTRPVDAMIACLLLKLGQLAKAQTWVRENKISAKDEPSYLHEFEHLTLARVLIAEYHGTQNEDTLQDALGLLSHLLRVAEGAQRTGSILEILVVQALAYQAQGNASLALESLNLALALAEPEGYFRLFVNEGKAMAGMLMSLVSSLKDDGQKKYVHKLLNAFGSRKTTQPAPASPQPLIDPLSERELEVLRLVAQGLSNEEIGRKLFVAVSTVKGHNLRIFGKLQTKSRTEAVSRARELGLL